MRYLSESSSFRLPDSIVNKDSFLLIFTALSGIFLSTEYKTRFLLSLGRYAPAGLQAGSGTGSPRAPIQTECLLLIGFSPTFPQRPQVLERCPKAACSTILVPDPPLRSTPAKVHTSILVPQNPEAQPSPPLTLACVLLLRARLKLPNRHPENPAVRRKGEGLSRHVVFRSPEDLKFPEC